MTTYITSALTEAGSFLPRDEARRLVDGRTDVYLVRHAVILYEQHMCRVGTGGKLYADGVWHGWGILDPARARSIADRVCGELEVDPARTPLVLDPETYRAYCFPMARPQSLRIEAFSRLREFASELRWPGTVLLYGVPFGDMRGWRIQKSTAGRRAHALSEAWSLGASTCAECLRLAPDLYWPQTWSYLEWVERSQASLNVASTMAIATPILWGRRPGAPMRDTYELAPLAHQVARWPIPGHWLVSGDVILWDAAQHHDPSASATERYARAASWVLQVASAMAPRGGAHVPQKPVVSADAMTDTVPSRDLQEWPE